jgi:cytochrome b6-f complex iron-sulfur subunit
VSRRRFLQMSSKSLGALALAGPVVSAISACSQDPLNSALGAGPPTANISNSPNDNYSFEYTNFPQLVNAGGSVQVTVQATSGTKNVFVTRVDANTADCVTTICTHAGCTLSPYSPGTQSYTCPCHGSVFSASGTVEVGPATSPLQAYATTITTTGIIVVIP